MSGFISRVEKEMNFGWAKANPELFVDAVKKFAEEYPVTEWRHHIDLSGSWNIKLIAVRREKPYEAVQDYIFDGNTYFGEIGLD